MSQAVIRPYRASDLDDLYRVCLLTKEFEKRLETDWWPALRDRYPAPPAALPQDQWTPDQRAASFMHAQGTTPDGLAEHYLSHLHINLVPRLQSRGLGLVTFAMDLRSAD
ncbi:MAG TPA: hypothetical protein VMB74_16930 [Streptosporangiaceae bacterium]|nr:hypothetical protein [Streptosporangiaceae bacterium]